MITGEKQIEYRDNTKWIFSRLYKKEISKTGLEYFTPKKYDFVKFTNGYGKDKPYFIAEFVFHASLTHSGYEKYSNGLEVLLTPGMHVIKIGRIIEKNN